MSRRPINLELRGLETPRERVWAAITRLHQSKLFPEGYSLETIQDHCEPMVGLTMVDDYVECLVKGGYLTKVPGTGGRKGVLQQPMLYTLAKPHGVAPRLDYAGKKVSMGNGNQAMWQAMKVLGSFDYKDIAKAATLNELVVSPGTAKSYVAHLARAGYLATLRPAKPGTPARHRLDKNTGPHAPAITRMKVVFDRNTGEFANLQTAQEVTDGLE